MGGSSVGENSHLVDMPEEDDVGAGQAQMMTARMNRMINTPLLYSEPAVSENCCIFKLPDRFKKMNGKLYAAPQIVSIGPYYRGNLRLQIITEKLKWQCLDYFINSSKTDLKLYIDGIRPFEIKAKGCYSRKFNPKEFLEMMVLDGCFILECLRFSYFNYRLGRILSKQEDWERHPLAQMESVKLLKIYGDLLLLENQIPFFVLKKIFTISKMTLEDTDTPLPLIGAKVFSRILGVRCYEDNYSRFHELECLHLLDMVRSIFIPPDHDHEASDRKEFPLAYIPFNTIPSISKLRRAGIKVKPGENDYFLELNFQHGVIEMPKIILNDLMCSFLVNCVAFEQCHKKCSQHFSVYALLLDCLVNTAGDVDYLCDYRVIENYIETDAVSFINNLGKGVTFDWGYLDFFVLCYDVNDYYRNTLHRHLTNFKGEYDNKPWLWISAFVAFVLLVLTFLQTYYAMNPKH